MKTSWSILYRGPLSSCNYACGYCPFAKRQNTREELRQDAAQLDRFVNWTGTRPERIAILFTPWGEALIQPYYQDALRRLSRAPNIDRVAIQTNLSCKLDWIEGANPQTLALWCTFHPSQVSLEKFVTQCKRLDAARIRYSVGIVGTREGLGYVERLRTELRPEVYLWVNAFKRDRDYYTSAEIEWLTRIDPLFPINNQHHASSGQSCRTGHQVFTVDGEGNMRRCHFVKTVIGNIYEDGFEKELMPRPCPAQSCGCHIGYVHLEKLALDEAFGGGLLERIPAIWPRTKTSTPEQFSV